MSKGELTYSQATGVLHHRQGDTVKRLGRGYSGQPPYVNKPEAEALRAAGPIPRGTYRVHRPFDHVRLGPWSLYLEPKTPIHGRSGFFIHGDNRLGNQTASHGCIILPRAVRQAVADLAPIDIHVG